MRDVRNLQAMLGEGITDSALLYRQIAGDDAPLVVADDGQEHECSCGEHLYSVGHHHAWGAHPVDAEGRWVGSCWGCGRQLQTPGA